MLEVVNYNNIKKGVRYIPLDINTNSKLYKSGLELIKFPFQITSSRKELEKTLCYIDERNLDCCVKVKSLIYDKNELIAYKITFYQDYKSLRRMYNRKFSLKKQDCLNIEQTFNKLTENNIQVCDHTLSNILLNKDNNILICDLDALEINNSNEVYKLNRKCLFVLALAYLYKLPANYVLALIKNMDVFLIENNMNLLKLFIRIENGEQVYMKELLDLINENDIKVKRKSLKKSVRQLESSGYYDKYF